MSDSIRWFGQWISMETLQYGPTWYTTKRQYRYTWNSGEFPTWYSPQWLIYIYIYICLYYVGNSYIPCISIRWDGISMRWWMMDSESWWIIINRWKCNDWFITIVHWIGELDWTSSNLAIGHGTFDTIRWLGNVGKLNM